MVKGISILMLRVCTFCYCDCVVQGLGETTVMFSNYGYDYGEVFKVLCLSLVVFLIVFW